MLVGLYDSLRQWHIDSKVRLLVGKSHASVPHHISDDAAYESGKIECERSRENIFLRQEVIGFNC